MPIPNPSSGQNPRAKSSKKSPERNKRQCHNTSFRVKQGAMAPPFLASHRALQLGLDTEAVHFDQRRVYRLPLEATTVYQNERRHPLGYTRGMIMVRRGRQMPWPKRMSFGHLRNGTEEDFMRRGVRILLGKMVVHL
ncbi:hypothetical protein ACVWY2_004600 [Bradyrhizobium sp. JR6.1]